MKNKADIAVAGLAVMGENLVLNMESKGFAVAVYNRTGSRTDDFMDGRGKGRNIIPGAFRRGALRFVETSAQNYADG